MRESFWGLMIVILGITSIFLVFFFQNVTNTSEHNYELLKETTESAMYDALDLAAYRADGTVRIDRERFVESFLRRFAENTSLAHTYKIDFYDINEEPPKVSIKVSTGGKNDQSTTTTLTNEQISFEISNRIDAILETKW